ncbi:hypothetical protein AB0L53_39025 [Nonomuraea sp. NPDC052129]|uniref:hypothetical protein n=1 Tax=Nonomuraea sp. NPDC052129 TaxID=3154651 RepID=UPI0034468B72
MRPAHGRYVTFPPQTQGVAALAGTTVPMLDPAVSGRITNGFLVTTSPVPARLSRFLTTTGLNLRPDGGGRQLLHSPHLDDRADDPAADVPGAVLDEIMGLLPNVLRATEGATVERAVVGRRAMPGDGLTVAGFAERGGGCTRWPRTAGSRRRRC